MPSADCGGVDPRGHRLLAIVDKDLHAVLSSRMRSLEERRFGCAPCSCGYAQYRRGNRHSCDPASTARCRVIGQAGVIRCIGCQLNGKAAVFARCHGDGQVGNAPADARQHSFILYSHIFVQRALTVGGIQLPEPGSAQCVRPSDAARAGRWSARTTCTLRLILGVRPGLQPRRHQAAPIGMPVWFWVA